jgi:deazaflavin-dependent oxidoreductase (nitroreductase family)
MSQPAPRGVARRLARLPIWLYRLGLGRLLGERFLLLTHIGRTSGRLRQTVVEVVRHDRLSDTYIIASGWGERADWYRNIQKTPRVLISVGARRMQAVAEPLPREVAARELRDYARRHPYAIRGLAKLVIGQSFDSSVAASERLAERVPLVALRPRR